MADGRDVEVGVADYMAEAAGVPKQRANRLWWAEVRWVRLTELQGCGQERAGVIQDGVHVARPGRHADVAVDGQAGDAFVATVDLCHVQQSLQSAPSR